MSVTPVPLPFNIEWSAPSANACTSLTGTTIKPELSKVTSDAFCVPNKLFNCNAVMVTLCPVDFISITKRSSFASEIERTGNCPNDFAAFRIICNDSVFSATCVSSLLLMVYIFKKPPKFVFISPGIYIVLYPSDSPLVLFINELKLSPLPNTEHLIK